ncbi:hypothetical protein [Wolbachia pipientis]|nr:hypothetical protein [Wolbachia pipientis]
MKVADTGFHPRGCHLSALTTWIQEKNGVIQVASLPCHPNA